MVRTTTNQKIGLIFLSIFLTLIIIESGLRITGLIITPSQKFKNQITEGKEEYRILCLGESTTLGSITTSGLHSWPTQLESILNKRSQNVEFKVFNAGKPGTNTAIILSRLEDNLEKYHPNMVITMIGVNDMYPPYMVYDESTREVKGYSFIKNMRTYKLSRLLWLHWKEKLKEVRKSTLKTAETMEYNSTGYFELGINYYTLEGNKEKAKKMFKKAIEKNPTDYRPYKFLGRCYYEANQLEEAEKTYKEAININPVDYESHYDLGDIYVVTNRLSEAEEMFKKAIKIKPKDDLAYFKLGKIYEERGELEEAEKTYKKAMVQNPENNLVYVALSSLYKNNNILDESEYLMKGILFNYHDPNTQHHYQLMYSLLNKTGIKLVVMQYPLRNINEFKDMFAEDQQKEITFISNEENFKKALENANYEDYFTDKFAGDFGHCTPKGNRLIAENVAETILKEINIQ